MNKHRKASAEQLSLFEAPSWADIMRSVMLALERDVLAVIDAHGFNGVASRVIINPESEDGPCIELTVEPSVDVLWLIHTIDSELWPVVCAKRGREDTTVLIHLGHDPVATRKRKIRLRDRSILDEANEPSL